MMRMPGAATALLCASVGACATQTPRTAATVAPTPAPTTVMPVATPTSPPRGSLQGFVDSLVGLPHLANAYWGVLIVAPERNDTLAQMNADRLFVPASNEKIVTSAVGLAVLGAKHQWQTTFMRTGPVVNGVLRGDVVVVGSGDPSISSAMRTDPLTAFDPLILALEASGVRRIAGRIRSSETPAFPGSPLGYGWDWDDLDAAYGAGVTELLFNDAFTDVQVRGCAAPGKPACVTTAPLRSSPVIRSAVVTRAAGTVGPPIEWWRDSANTPGLTLRGSIPAGETMTFSASQPDGRATFLAAVTEALARAGITVRNRVSADQGRRDTLAVLQSRTLGDVLPALLKPSQNQLAEVVFRSIGRERTGVGTPDSARVAIERELTAWGVRPDAHAIRDGSGLSRHDYLTPRAIVQVLDTTRRRADFSVFYDAMPIAGLEGTLKTRMQAFAQGRVRAKTGTVDKVRALSGYVTTADGEMLIFSLITNNHTVPNREVDRIHELIVEQLVTMRRGAPR